MKLAVAVPRAALMLSGHAKGKYLQINLGVDRILFFKMLPVAVVTGEAVYRHDDGSAAISRVLNEIAGDRPIIRSSAADFDFILGSTLTKNGINLTRRPETL